jgi:aspartate racemase
MKTIEELLSHLRSLNIKLWLEGESLRYSAPKGVLTPELRFKIKERKIEIVNFLQKVTQISGRTLPPVQSLSRDEVLPLSFTQQRLWFLHQLEKESAAYHLYTAFRLTGRLKVGILEKSLTEIIRRHEVLHTTFSMKDGNAIQIIAPVQPMTLQKVNLSSLAEQSAKVQQIFTNEFHHPFDLSKGPLLRGTLLQLGEKEHVLLLTMHHIISDGWSRGIFYRELSALYDAFGNGQPSPLSKLPIQYIDFAAWQRTFLQGKMLDEQLSYWKQQIDGFTTLDLPTDKVRPPQQTFRGSRHFLSFPKSLSQAIKALSQQEGVSLFISLLTAFTILLYRYTGQDDLVIGTATANRTVPEIEDLIGCFINTLALRTKIENNPNFRELLARVKQTTLDAYEHQHLPFEKLVEELQLSRDMSRSPIFQVMLVLQNAPTRRALQLTGLTLTPLMLDPGIAQFDLNCHIWEEGEELRGFFEYNTDLFEASTIERMQGHFQILLEGIVANPSQQISILPLLTKTEQRQLLVEWNHTQTEYPQDQCIHQLFEAQVEKTPDAVALVFEDQQLTYKQLNNKANQLAHYLKTLGVEPEVLVGLCVERSVEMIVGLLGILKVGGAYVPLDPDFPQKRLQFMLEDSSVPVLLSQSHLLSVLPVSTAFVIYLDSEWEHIAAGSEDNLVIQSGAENLAYVIYTSGSTGQPKGVLIEHKSMVNYLIQIIKHFDIGCHFAMVSTIAADLGNTVLFGAFCTGGCLHVLSQENVTQSKNMADYLSRYSIDYLKIVPSHLIALQTSSNSEDIMPHKLLILGGEASHLDWVKTLVTYSSQCAILNHYGPTEATIGVLTYPVEKDSLPYNCAVLPIGRPIANIQTYILDHHRKLVPIGLPGELHIGGAGLARGYLNRSDLTAEKFIKNPFSNDPDDRLYKTGDLVRYLQDGNIEFIGRIDNQVKLRGFRIELGEIEAVLVQHPEVREAVVIIREDHPGDKRLVAYLVPNAQEVMPSILRHFLKEKLPDYMVPSAFVQMEAMPLTPNGKIDRRALPAPKQTQENHESFVAPQDQLEQQLANLWEKVLHVHPIGRHDNFFERGGHSLLAVTLLAQIEKAFGQGLPLITLFQAPTIAQFADILRDEGYKATWRALQAIQPQGSRPPLFFIGSTDYARAIAPSQGTDQPVYGLNLFGLQPANGTTPSLTVEWIARQYIQEIQTVQPEGPYYLCGYCGDAKVAFEMALQLQAQKQSVALLAFIDVIWGISSTQLQNRYVRFWHNLLEFGSSYLFYKIREKIKFFQERLFLRLSKLEKEKKRYEQTGEALPLQLQHRLLIKSFFQALAHYVPQPYSGGITLFLSYEWRSKDSSALANLVTGGVEVHEIAGYHRNLFEEPQVSALGEQIKRCLEKTQNANDSNG